MKEKDYIQLRKNVAAVGDVVDKADYVKNAYFWSGDNGNRYQRARREEQLSGEAEWDEGGHHYSASVQISQSRRNTYVYREYYKDGARTNLKAIRYSLKRMEDELAVETEKRAKRAARKAAKEAAAAEVPETVTA